MSTQKAYAYIARRNTDGLELLVFRQKDHPEAGLQIPGGTVEDGEKPEVTAHREVLEEAGLTEMRLVQSLGSRQYSHKTKQELQERFFFHFSTSSQLPETWDYTVASKSEDQGFVFEYSWMPLEQTFGLAGRQGELVYKLKHQPGFELQQIILYLLRIGRKSLNRLNLPENAQPDVAAIFCLDQFELGRLTTQIELIGKEVEETETGITYLLDTPYAVENDSVRLIKLRHPDPTRIWRGDVDYKLAEYNKYQLLSIADSKLIERPGYSMVEITDPLSDVLLYFSNPPLSQDLGA